MVMNLLKSKNLSHINDLLNHNLHKLYLGLNFLYCDLKRKIYHEREKKIGRKEKGNLYTTKAYYH